MCCGDRRISTRFEGLDHSDTPEGEPSDRLHSFFSLQLSVRRSEHGLLRLLLELADRSSITSIRPGDCEAEMSGKCLGRNQAGLTGVAKRSSGLLVPDHGSLALVGDTDSFDHRLLIAKRLELLHNLGDTAVDRLHVGRRVVLVPSGFGKDLLILLLIP